MCRHYAPAQADACDEDDAIEVRDKTAANFCDWFVPRPAAYDGREQRADEAARQKLDALFGGSATAGDATGPASDSALADAEKLFRK
jgi:hypothetical protein